MKIYTKTGDDGSTSLFDGTRVPKDHERVAVYGEIDTLNAMLGLASSHLADTAPLKQELRAIQRSLFALGAKLANPKEKKQSEKSDFDAAQVAALETAIDRMQDELPALTRFILPGGTPAAAALHLARTTCRAAERFVVALARHETLPPLYVRYLNRLSDYLFVAARYANQLGGQTDILW